MNLYAILRRKRPQGAVEPAREVPQAASACERVLLEARRLAEQAAQARAAS